MRVVSFFMWAGLVLGQAAPDGVPLLRAVADSFRNLKTVQVEGRMSQDFDLGFAMKLNLSFKAASLASRKLRIEMSGGDGGSFAVCDGDSGWMYDEKGKFYLKVVPGGRAEGDCNPGTLLDFEHITDNLRSAVITGASHAQFEGRAQPCVVVEAQYRVINNLMLMPRMITKVGRVKRKMCIDDARKLVLSDHLEADLNLDFDGGAAFPGYTISDISYDRIDRNPDLSAALFEFHPPEGASELPPPAPLKASPLTAHLPGAAVVSYATQPEIVSREEPEYSQEAWDEGIQGQLVLLPEIAPDGTILDVKVKQSLGWGLDEKGIECVRKWRFRPGTLEGKPVKGAAYVTMNFWLPNERPAHPSAGPVARPLPPARLPEVELKMPSDQDNFLNVVANNFKAPAVCKKIDPFASGGGGGFSGRGYQIQGLRSQCYLWLAERLKDPSLCDHLVPVRTAGANGAGFNKEYCLANLNGSSVSVVPHRMDAFANMMRKIGYDDAQIQAVHYGPDERSFRDTIGDKYWLFVRHLLFKGSPEEKAEFLRRVLAME